MSDREDSLGSGFASQVGKSDGKPILASLDVASELLRKLASDALDRRGDFVDGKIDSVAAQAGDVSDARALSDLFMGKGLMASDYFVQPWNSANQLGEALVESYKMECDPEDAVFTVLISMLSAIYGEIDFIERNKMDIEEQGWRLDGLIEMYAHALAGIPYPSEEE